MHSVRSGCRRPARDPGCRLAAALLGFAATSAAVPGWVAETPRFRVLAAESPGLGAAAAQAGAEALEASRAAFLGAGLGEAPAADSALEVLLVPARLHLRALLRERRPSGTRGVTVRGLDRNLVVVAWHARPEPKVTLAHEYAHQLEDPDWPLWLREGRAVYLARRVQAHEGGDPLSGLFALLDRPEWIPWPELLAAEADGPSADGDIFQAQAWLLVHWLAQRDGIGAMQQAAAAAQLTALGAAGLDDQLRRHLSDLRQAPRKPPFAREPGATPRLRPAEPWEIPLLQAEVLGQLRFLDEAEARLEGLRSAFPAAARVEAAYAGVQLLRGRQDAAERHFGRALRLGDARARTAYRYALLLMRPGLDAEARAANAERHALHATERMPREPTHHLALAQARMLRGDWNGAFDALGRLAEFPGWGHRTEQEAREVRRRRGQALAAEPPPQVRAAARPALDLPAAVPPQPPWKPAGPASAAPRPVWIWPPYGTWLVHGRIAWVDCSDGTRKVIVHSSYQRLVLREDPKLAPQLINRPFRERRIPCSSRGWQVAVAYRKSPGDDGTAGVLVGVRF